MSAPSYVPQAPRASRTYQSPTRTRGTWSADRPGDLGGAGQPEGTRLGNPGPDQGYVLNLLDRFDDRLHLSAGESLVDVRAGCAAVAMKRAALFSRAPMIHDLTVAFTIWGFLDENADDELLDLREHLFSGIGHAHHDVARRAVPDAVSAEALHQPHGNILRAYADNWRTLISSDAAADVH